MVIMRATITATTSQTRVLIEDESGDRLLARLPPLTQVAHPRALSTLLEALALWCGQPVPVALCVDETFDWQRSGLDANRALSCAACTATGTSDANHVSAA